MVSRAIGMNLADFLIFFYFPNQMVARKNFAAYKCDQENKDGNMYNILYIDKFFSGVAELSQNHRVLTPISQNHMEKYKTRSPYWDRRAI
jgi:hypothetical protein